MNTSKLNSLIKECTKGKRNAQAELFNLFAAKMFGLCMYYAKSKTDAEDYLHNGFIKVYECIKQYKGTGSFEGWMRKVFINTILTEIRRKIHFEEHIEEVCSENTRIENIETEIDSKDMIRMIQDLSPAYRMVFNLYAIEGYSHKEIASMLNISEGTSKSNLSRARNILQDKLKKTYPIETQNQWKTV